MSVARFSSSASAAGFNPLIGGADRATQPTGIPDGPGWSFNPLIGGADRATGYLTTTVQGISPYVCFNPLIGGADRATELNEMLPIEDMCNVSIPS